MLIVIDYDETYTADKELFNQIIPICVARGHTVICCTNRTGNQYVDREVFDDMGALNVPIVFAAKPEFRDKWDAVEAAGYVPENAKWFDDSPEFILQRNTSEMPER